MYFSKLPSAIDLRGVIFRPPCIHAVGEGRSEDGLGYYGNLKLFLHNDRNFNINTLQFYQSPLQGNIKYGIKVIIK